MFKGLCKGFCCLPRSLQGFGFSGLVSFGVLGIFSVEGFKGSRIRDFRVTVNAVDRSLGSVLFQVRRPRA